MSFSLFRQACRVPQIWLPRQLLHTPVAYLNTSAQRRDENDPFADIAFINVPGGGHDTPEELWKQNSVRLFNDTIQTAYSCRSVTVHEGDIATAAKMLDKIVMTNGVSRDWYTNKRHKPKGEERRRLESLRWRRRFKSEVGKKVALVQQIRKHLSGKLQIFASSDRLSKERLFTFWFEEKLSANKYSRIHLILAPESR
ncbi:Bi-functional secreted alpha-amylase dextrinase [Pyrrhoderma noxium]|uniref:Bi-functional secreted alpha-amylase dextrinase n=1 Tax=Pyrrhoderma noxium TaxID=2282107 RepID=A0A286UVS2_9AGAM|nr:Bi-functional secreted alpha-amylase dextrinase [Pyrrhoderma noxium]